MVYAHFISLHIIHALVDTFIIHHQRPSVTSVSNAVTNSFTLCKLKRQANMYEAKNFSKRRLNLHAYHLSLSCEILECHYIPFLKIGLLVIQNSVTFFLIAQNYTAL